MDVTQSLPRFSICMCSSLACCLQQHTLLNTDKAATDSNHKVTANTQGLKALKIWISEETQNVYVTRKAHVIGNPECNSQQTVNDVQCSCLNSCILGHLASTPLVFVKYA